MVQNNFDESASSRAAIDSLADPAVVSGTRRHLEAHGIVFEIGLISARGWCCTTSHGHQVLAVFFEDGHSETLIRHWALNALCALVAATLIDEARRWELCQLEYQRSEEDDWE